MKQDSILGTDGLTLFCITACRSFREIPVAAITVSSMSPDGGDFACQECHLTGADHNTAGSLADFDLTGEGPMMACIECHTEGNEYGGPVMHVDTPELNA